MFLGVFLGLGVVSFLTVGPLTSVRESQAVVYAQNNQPVATNLTDNQTNTLDQSQRVGADAKVSESYVTTLETILKVIYLFMRPFLAIAGASLDNSLVYGQLFYLDTTLRKFRNIMRSFANYTLGFLFVGSIGYAFFKQDAQIIKKVIQRLAISVLVVNMSRWLMAAMIDLSTIAVVNFGALPLYAIGDAKLDPIFSETTYLKAHGYVNLSSTTRETQDQASQIVIHSCALDTSSEKYYIPCRIENNVMIPKGVGASDPQTRQDYERRVVDARGMIEGQPLTEQMINDNYCVYNGKLITNAFGEIPTIDNLNQREAEGKEYAKDICINMNQIYTRASGTSGPLYTLYNSIFSMAHIALTPNTGSLVEASLEMMMKALVGLALVVPLIAFAVAMLIRVVFLWAFIAFVPILVLAYVFEFKKVESAMGGKFSMGTVVGLIFLPVFAVFALSISIIFLTLIQNISFIEKEVGPSAEAPVQPDGFPNDMLTIVMGEDVKRNCSDYPTGPCCYDFLNITEICVQEGIRRTGANVAHTMSWLVGNIFGIILMRTVIFAVLKSNAITKGAVETIEGFAKKAMGSIPVIPVAGGIGLGAAQQAVKDIQTNIPREIQQKQYEQSGIEEWWAGKKADIAGDPQRQMKQLRQDLSTTSDMQQYMRTAQGTPDNNITDYNAIVPDIGQKIAQNSNYANAGSARNRNQAFRNDDFVRFLQDSESYNTDFFNRREKSRVPATRTQSFQMMEDGMKSVANQSFEGPRRNDGTRINYYLHNGRLVRFSGTYDSRNNLVPESEEITTLLLRNPIPDNEGFAAKAEAESLIRLMNDYGGLDELRAAGVSRVFGNMLDQTNTANAQRLQINPADSQATITVQNERWVFDVVVENGKVLQGDLDSLAGPGESPAAPPPGN